MYFQHHCHLALHWEYGPATIIRFGNKISTTYYFTTQSQLLATLSKKHYENIEGKREKAGNQHFLFFPQCFQPYPEDFRLSPRGRISAPFPIQISILFSQFSYFFSQLHTIKKKNGHGHLIPPFYPNTANKLASDSLYIAYLFRLQTHVVKYEKSILVPELTPR